MYYRLKDTVNLFVLKMLFERLVNFLINRLNIPISEVPDDIKEHFELE